MSGDFEIERRCLYDKRPGIVQLSHTHLVWTPDSKAVRFKSTVFLNCLCSLPILTMTSSSGSPKRYLY